MKTKSIITIVFAIIVLIFFGLFVTQLTQNTDSTPSPAAPVEDNLDNNILPIPDASTAPRPTGPPGDIHDMLPMPEDIVIPPVLIETEPEEPTPPEPLPPLESEIPLDVADAWNTLVLEINELVLLKAPLSIEVLDELRARINEAVALGIKTEVAQVMLGRLDIIPVIPEEEPVTEEPTEPMPEVSAYDELPACDGQQLTMSPIATTELFEITPLGAVNPPGHTQPTDHLYLHITAPGMTENLESLVAPADMYLVDVTTRPGGEASMILALCKNKYIYFDHIKEMSRDVMDIIGDTHCRVMTENPETLCSRRVVAPISAGTLLGKVGGLQGNFDFGAYDLSAPLSFISPDRYGNTEIKSLDAPRSIYITCPLDWFTTGVRTDLYKKVYRTGSPKCGTTLYDQENTLKGNWYLLGTTGRGTPADRLSFVRDNDDPSLLVISIGGTLTSPGKWTSTPLGYGITNRPFTEITPGSQVHCYDVNGTGKLLVQLTDADTLKTEIKDGACGPMETINDPTTYSR